MKWAIGLTTVPERREKVLPQTIQSLVLGGFIFGPENRESRLFIDGWSGVNAEYFPFGVASSHRWPRIGPWGNWFLGLQELFIRNPTADRYAIFQDDIAVYRNLREYLEKVPFPEKGYWNLYTDEANYKATVQPFLNGGGRGRISGGSSTPPSPSTSPASRPRKDEPTGFLPARAIGRGALALVFSREVVPILLHSPITTEKPLDARWSEIGIDGAVHDALAYAGYQEFIHHPSLVQTLMAPTTIQPPRERPPAPEFWGEELDALVFLEGRRITLGGVEEGYKATEVGDSQSGQRSEAPWRRQLGRKARG